MSDYNPIVLGNSTTRYENADGKSYSLGKRTLYASTVGNKRYYSSIDAEIYIGDTFIDDVVQISWSIEQATMPLFGYNSYTFDDIAVGARQISGNFMINFTKSGFMYEVLENAESISRSSLYTDNDADYKLSWSSYNEKEHMPGWNRSFNIVVGYGDYNADDSDSSVTLLRCVQITGCQQVLSAEGGPIGEIYSFIAKDVRFDIGKLPEVNVTEETEGEEEETEPSVFTFSVKLSSIDYDTRIIDPRLYAGRFKFNLEYETKNGTITDIGLILKDHNVNGLNASYYSMGAGTDSTIAHHIYVGVHDSIISTMNTQKAQFAEDNETYLYYDLSVTYISDDDSTSKVITLTNQKVFINEITSAQ